MLKDDLNASVNAEQAEARAIARVAEWEKAMQRAFKGILPRPVRRATLERAAERQAADA